MLEEDEQGEGCPRRGTSALGPPKKREDCPLGRTSRVKLSHQVKRKYLTTCAM